jgi:SAM-dependent methyltransferase
MDISKEQLAQMIAHDAFPLSAKYDPEWVIENQMGPSALWLTESLCGLMDLQPGMRVLDMGCGKAMSSIFLAKEFGVQVWANDLWIPASDNWARICEAGVEEQVFPIHAEAHDLPYGHDFFDAIVSLDSYHYYATDDLYLMYFIRFLKPGGQIGIVVPGLMQEFDGATPEHLTQPAPDGSRWWDPAECSCFHTAPWWRRLWEQTELVEIEHADMMPDGWRDWLQFENAKTAAGKNLFPNEALMVEADAGRYLGFVRMVGRRGGAK